MLIQAVVREIAELRPGRSHGGRRGGLDDFVIAHFSFVAPYSNAWGTRGQHKPDDRYKPARQ